MLAAKCSNKQKIKKILKNKMKEAANAKKLFSKIFAENHGVILSADEAEKTGKITAFVFFPENDNELNYYGLLYMDDFLAFNNYESAVVITSNKMVVAAAPFFSKKIKNTYSFSEREMECFFSYWELHKFSEACRFVSLDKPTGRRGSNILGYKGVGKEQIVGIGIYHILPFRKIDNKIAFDSENAELKKFVGGELN